MVSPIRLPDDAPFSAEQRAWLDAFLHKALAGITMPEPVGPAVPVTVLYATQTGNAEGLAKKLFKTLAKGNFTPILANAEDYDRTLLPKEENLLVIASTYGDGEPPDSAASFHTWLLNGDAPSLDGVNFSVLALGDTSYPDFCKCGAEIDTRLAELGANRLTERVESDVDTDEPYSRWSSDVLKILAPGAAARVETADEDAAEDGFSKNRPFPATVLENRNLNGPGAKETHHIALSLAESGLEYEVGDALAVYPGNRPEVVDEIIASLPFKPSTVTLADGTETGLRDALLHHYDIGAINPAFVKKWQTRSGSPMLRSLVEADDKNSWDTFCHGRDLIDLVVDYPADFTDAEDFTAVLRKLQPRLYSIASSPLAHPGEVHLCIGIVRYESFGRKRGGICSTYFSDRIAADTKPRVYVHTSPAFRLPNDGSTPLIMVGPGTGIAPFRAFLEDRKATGATGKNWLFFGNPHSATDYLYGEELDAYLQDGTLAKLDLAWSRDQGEKVYVQHLMQRNGAELWKWFQEGAAFYVCGDASRMAKDVDDALHQLAINHGGKDEAGAKAWVEDLKKAKRYQRDVY
ncbi:MAG: flavodoxin domain-containing protein [Verrucomicrobiota bacterium]